MNKARLLSALEDVIDLSLLHTEGDEWIIDSVHRLGVEFGGDSTIVFFLDEHTHFWEMDNNEEYDFIEETASYVRTLLSGQDPFRPYLPGPQNGADGHLYQEPRLR